MTLRGSIRRMDDLYFVGLTLLLLFNSLATLLCMCCCSATRRPDLTALPDGDTYLERDHDLTYSGVRIGIVNIQAVAHTSLCQ
jgi:hypothetical protein